jgi:parvulin-like peptidyl-prolyl isomerase
MKVSSMTIFTTPVLCLCFAASIAWSQPDNSVVAKIGSTEISRADYLRELNQPSTSDLTTGLSLQESKLKVLDSLVTQKILLLEANQQKIEPKPGVIDEQFMKEKKMYGDDAKFEKELKKKGITEKQYKQNLVEQYKVSQLLYLNVYSRLKPIQLEDAKKYYQQHISDYRTGDAVRIRHIFVAVPENATPEQKAEKKAKIDMAYNLIQSGEDFKTVAMKFSETLASTGGDLGRPIHKGDLVSFPQIENMAFSLQTGQYSPVMESNKGFHIIKVENKIMGQVREFDTVKVPILESLREQSAIELYNNWIGQLKVKYNVVLYPENL